MKLFSTEQAAKYLNKPFGTFKRMIVDGRINGKLIGKSLVFTEAQLEAIKKGEAIEAVGILGSHEAAAQLNIHPRTLLNAHKRGEIAAHRVGSSLVFLAEDVAEFEPRRQAGRPMKKE